MLYHICSNLYRKKCSSILFSKVKTRNCFTLFSDKIILLFPLVKPLFRDTMATSPMNTPEIKFLGWDEPAIKLVAEKLLEGLNTPQTAAQYRRATVVVPTAGSGQRLREYMTELSMQKYGKSLLMPRIALAGNLIPSEYPGVATEILRRS